MFLTTNGFQIQCRCTIFKVRMDVSLGNDCLVWQEKVPSRDAIALAEVLSQGSEKR